jgi:hypothetical protein
MCAQQHRNRGQRFVEHVKRVLEVVGEYRGTAGHCTPAIAELVPDGVANFGLQSHTMSRGKAA